MNAMMNLHRSFGLQGLSAYIPKEPVEIIDGNSKVTTYKQKKKPRNAFQIFNI